MCPGERTNPHDSIGCAKTANRRSAAHTFATPSCNANCAAACHPSRLPPPNGWCSANGKKGFLATAAKYGRDFAVRMAAAWRRSRQPTDLESQVEAWLDEFQMHHERDAPVGGYFADFLLCDLDLIVEVDGHVWHTNHQLHGQDRVTHDKRKDKALRRQGYTVLRLPESAIRNGSAKDALDRAITQQLFRHVPAGDL